MAIGKSDDLEAFLGWVGRQNAGQAEYLQAVEDVVRDIWAETLDTPAYARNQILQRLVEPDRIIRFKVVWQDDLGQPHVERGWRVQHSNAIGPYKGGLRFSSDLNESVLKFLAFEQTFKNSLTGLPLGGGKGGATFTPRGRSDDEVMRFCQSFMTELWTSIGPSEDVPAGDIGVGSREIGYLFGQYKRLTRRFEGALTGKGPTHGGSAVRSEATGYGAVMFLEAMLERAGRRLEGNTVAISGSGNVSLHAAERIIASGGLVISLSDTGGVLHAPAGFDRDQLARIKKLKLEDRGRLAEAADMTGLEHIDDGKPWSLPCDIAMPCATQNELDADDAKQLIEGGTIAVVEGANMPCTPEAMSAFRSSTMLLAPAKAANAGGVAVSGLEMAQNAARLSWSEDRVLGLLEETMLAIHDCCEDAGQTSDGSRIDYVRGANIAGFRKVADAMVAHGLV